MAGNVCLFNKCHGPAKWKPYGTATKEAATYSKLLQQKREFQQFIEFNDNQDSKTGKIDSYCIVDKRYSPSKGSNIDIFIFDEEHHGGLYLEYSVHKQYIIKNCNDLMTFLNFNNNSTLLVHNSFIYVKSTDRSKWPLFFSVLEFLINNLNKSVIGSQFYFPLFSKYFIMNELRFLHILQSVHENFIKTFSQACEISTLKLKKVLPSMLPYPKTNTSFPSEEIGKKVNLNTYTCKPTKKVQLKRKSTDLTLGDDCLPKPKRLSSEKNECQCQNLTWKIFIPIKIDTFFNYIGILEAKKVVDDSKAMSIFPFNNEFQTNSVQYPNSFSLNENLSNLNQDLSSILNTHDNFSAVHCLDKVNELKNTDLYTVKAEENKSKFEHISNLHTLKEIESASDKKECSTFDNFPISAIECKNEEIHPKKIITIDRQNNIAGPSVEKLSETEFSQINKHFATFQTASGKSLKISETALKAAEKMFKEISVEEIDAFPEKKTQNKQSSKECYPNLKEYIEEDMNEILADNFFEDIAFDEKEIDSKPTDNSATLSVQKAEITQIPENRKIRKSLGGRRSLKPYTLKK